MRHYPSLQEIVAAVEALLLPRRKKAPQGRKPHYSDELIIALAVRQSTLVPYAWISNRLHMGIPKSMGTLLHRAKKMAETDLKTRAWIERLSS